MGQFESICILPRTISHHIEYRQWQPIHEFLYSTSIHRRIKQCALMNVSRGKLKSPFLNLACSYNAPRTIIAAALKLCGKDLICCTNINGETVLHCSVYHPLERCQMFLDVAGQDILYKRSKSGYTPFQVLFIGRNPSMEEIELYLEYGGKELLYIKDMRGHNILHIAIKNMRTMEIISFLIHLGGKELVIEKDNNGLIPLDYFFMDFHDSRDNCDDDEMIQLFTLLVQTAGFDFYAGGLFLSNEDCPCGIRTRMTVSSWMIPIRETTVRWCLIYRHACIARNIVDIVSSVFQGKPFLQMAIPFVSKDCIVQIIEKFHGCMNTRDQHGKLPIEVAVDVDLGWYHGGMKEILAATISSDDQQHCRSKLVVACTYGFKWKSGGGIGRILEDCNIDELREIDPVSGLYPALLLAASHGSDVDAIYDLILREPCILLGGCNNIYYSHKL